MAANKKPRKAYVRKYAGTPIVVRHGASNERTLQLIPHLELDKLVNGTATEQAYHTLACRLNIGYTLDQDPVIFAGLSALVAVKIRNSVSGKWGVSGDECKAIGKALAMTDTAQLNSTRRQARDALRKVFAEAAV